MFYNKPLTLSKWALLAEKKLSELIKDIKFKICVLCTKNVDNIPQTLNNSGIQLPCSCLLCSKKCVNNYLNLIFSKKIKKGKKIYI